MIYITGDTHRNFRRIMRFCNEYKTTRDDVMMILGDAGINYTPGENDTRIKNFIKSLPITLFCIHGNHEQRPTADLGYEPKPYRGGIVMVEPKFPHILFALDGEVYDFAGKACIVLGGAYSVDKHYRVRAGFGWWSDEQPSDEIKQKAEAALEARGWNIDIVLSHTAPLKYEPVEVFLPGFDQSKVDKSTEQWLDTIEDKLHYSAWLCGHYHTRKTIDKIRFLFEDYTALESGEATN